MQIPSNIIFLINVINSVNLYYIFGVVFIVFYFLFALFTWSFIKPLKYIGSVNITVGIMFMAIKLISPIVNSLIANNIIKDILPTIINPLFISGLICFSSGILLVIIFSIINKIISKKISKDIKTKEKVD